MTAKTLYGNEITQDILARLLRLEQILICKHCGGEGRRPHNTMGTITCFQCEGSGNRLDDLIHRVDML